MTGLDSGLPSDYAGRVAASIANWKRKLLDLSRRNRALNFKVTKVSTIAIVDEQPAEVFRRLYLDEASMRFKASANKETDERERPNDQPVFELSLEDDYQDNTGADEQSPRFVPYDPAAVDDRHSDEWLQTTLSPEALDHSLRRIEEQARSTVEEQGVNTLFLALGMLRYRESRDSEVWFKAPLILLPVELSRKSARAGYSVAVSDDDALINPALVEYLRTGYGITLPDLPEASLIDASYDLQSFFKGTEAVVSAQPDWAIQTEVYLCLLSFQKLVMFKDLESNADPIGAHRLIRQLLAKTGEPVIGLPSEIRDLSLDRDFAPESNYQVVDADSSQMRAAAAVTKGNDIVIEGPPGTGKSQTITNLVAQALAAGKSVLFVAEKMAALEVVHRRLVAAGLGEFCLELHSSKANKRSVMKELSTALDASVQAVATSTTASRRLPEVRASLTNYVNAVHRPFGALQRSLFHAVGELGQVTFAPRIKLDVDIRSVTDDQFEEATRRIAELEAHGRSIGEPASHPWRDTHRTIYTEDDLASVVETATKIADSTRVLVAESARIPAAFGILQPTTLAEVESLIDVARLFADSPGVDSQILLSDEWNEAPNEALSLLRKIEKREQLRVALTTKFHSDVLEYDHSSDIAFVEQKSASWLSFLAFANSRYRSIKSHWKQYRLSGYAASLLEQASDLKPVATLNKLNEELDRAQNGKSLFGPLWRGTSSRSSELRSYIEYVVRYRKTVLARRISEQAAAVAKNKAPDTKDILVLVNSATAIRKDLNRLSGIVGWPDDYLASSALVDIQARAAALVSSRTKAPAFAAFEASRQKAAATIASETVSAATKGSIRFDQLTPAFKRAFYVKWITAVVQAEDVLSQFNTLTHEELVSEFRRLDQQVLLQNRVALVGLLRDRTQTRLRQPEALTALPKLRKEMAKQRRHSPLRRIIKECNGAIRAIKPCLMMSPLTVAQYIDGNQPTFDLVIFDEASQLPTEDAIGAITRGRQLVVVGDPKQLPPTNFFSVSSGAVTAPLGDDGSPMFEDSESVLEEFMGASVPMSRLKWHYRSAHESLISFSNVQFYDSDLHTFPSVVTNTDTAGVQFHYVTGAVYEGKGLNITEARQIADEVVAFAKLQARRRASGLTQFSLGVGTLNLRQQLAIQDELEVRRRMDPSIEDFFSRNNPEPFFVKNLENIQGDERDAIFLSITFGKGLDGRLRYNFGPLNRENGWRRLNVLVTRARRQMKVFSSIRHHDINPTGATSDGPRLLRDFLAYAENGQLSSPHVSTLADADSPFERDVLQELARAGIKVQPQVGVSGYRIDIGVLDNEFPGRFVCGIECDGVAYHSMETVRDRDRLRQQVLEDRGWTIHRVWSTDWFKDRQGQIERLLGLIGQSAARLREEGPERESKSDSPDIESVPFTPALHSEEQSLEEAYARPEVGEYKAFDGRGILISGELLAAPVELLVELVTSVVNLEGPVHEVDITNRLTGLWSTKAGSRIQASVQTALSRAVREQRIQKRAAFYWRVDNICRARTRLHTGIPGDRIAPEEYVDAIRLILANGHAFSRGALIAETRAIFGFSRTGAVLEEAIGMVVDALIVDGSLGEGSTGLTLRRSVEA